MRKFISHRIVIFGKTITRDNLESRFWAQWACSLSGNVEKQNISRVYLLLWLCQPSTIKNRNSESYHFPCGSAGKESACNAGDLGLNPGLGRFPWRKERLPIPVFWPREFHRLMGSQRVRHSWATFTFQCQFVGRKSGWHEWSTGRLRRRCNLLTLFHKR